MKTSLYFPAAKSVIYIFLSFLFATALGKAVIASDVIPRFIPVCYSSGIFAVLSLSLILLTIIAKRGYVPAVFFLLVAFAIYTIIEVRFFLPLYYSSRALVSVFFLLYLLQFLALLALGAYLFRYCISPFFLLIDLVFLLVLQPKLQIIPLLVFAFIVFVNVYTYGLALLIRYVVNQNATLAGLNEEQRHTMRQLMRARKKIIAQEKLATIATFSAGLAHEINNPVNYMAGNLHFLEDYQRKFESKCSEFGLDDAEVRHALNDMQTILRRYREGFDRIIQIIASMKQSSPKSEDTHRREDIARILDDAVTVVRKTVETEIEFVCTIDRPLYYSCNPSDILTLAINFLTNAVDAVNSTDRPKRIILTARQELSGLRLQFSDNGCGIDPDNQAHIFDPFYSTKESRENIGVGLTLCRSIVHNYNGHIEVESNPGRSTTITVELPDEDRLEPETATIR